MMIEALLLGGYIAGAILTYGLSYGRTIWQFALIADVSPRNDFVVSVICGIGWPATLLPELRLWRRLRTPLVFNPKLILLPMPLNAVNPAFRDVFASMLRGVGPFGTPESVGMFPVFLSEEAEEWLKEHGCVATSRGNILFRTEVQRIEFVLRFG
jgi:hypothetical protein